jgi:integrase
MARKRSLIPRPKNKNGTLACYANGKDHYFGPFGSTEAEQAYQRFIVQFSSSGTTTQTSSILLHVYKLFAASGDAPKTTNKRKELAGIVLHFGELAQRPLESISPHEWKEFFRAKSCDCVNGVPRYAKTTLQRWFTFVKRLYSFAVENRVITGDMAAPVLAVKRLPIDSARRSEDVKPVPREDVLATLPHLTPTVAAMVRLQLLTGMRPSEVFEMTGAEIVRTGTVTISGMTRQLGELWAYVHREHKTAHHGHARVILLNKECQEILAPRLDRDKKQPLFTPEESVAESFKLGKLTYERGRVGARPLNAKWIGSSYAQAIERAAKRAGVPHWTPYQIRHLVASEVQAKYGLDYARAMLGQKSFSMAAHYADWDFTKAQQVSSERQ